MENTLLKNPKQSVEMPPTTKLITQLKKSVVMRVYFENMDKDCFKFLLHFIK